MALESSGKSVDQPAGLSCSPSDFIPCLCICVFPHTFTFLCFIRKQHQLNPWRYYHRKNEMCILCVVVLAAWRVTPMPTLWRARSVKTMPDRRTNTSAHALALWPSYFTT